ncbi:MAG: BrnT family toxin [Pseudomonadota bacterium]
MIIEGFIWLTDIIDKIENKHGVVRSEVESVFVGIPVFNRIGRGRIRGEDLYRAMGQADSGRYLTVFFIYKMTHEALVVSPAT